MRGATLSSLWMVAVSCLVGCPSSPSNGDRATSDAQSASPTACTHVGQTCEFAPNKLGSCVQRDNCTTDCLVCQSQH